MYRRFEPTTESRAARLEQMLAQHLKDYPTFEEQRVAQTFQEQRDLLLDQYQEIRKSRQALQQLRHALQRRYQACQEQHQALQQQKIRRQKKQMWRP